MEKMAVKAAKVEEGLTLMSPHKADQVITIPLDKVELWLAQIREMNEMYTDESRDDWFEADDIARAVADDLEGTIMREAPWLLDDMSNLRDDRDI